MSEILSSMNQTLNQISESFKKITGVLKWTIIANPVKSEWKWFFKINSKNPNLSIFVQTFQIQTGMKDV
jgi:hypothetical protein